jgi:hypothetical protein
MTVHLHRERCTTVAESILDDAWVGTSLYEAGSMAVSEAVQGHARMPGAGCYPTELMAYVVEVEWSHPQFPGYCQHFVLLFYGPLAVTEFMDHRR